MAGRTASTPGKGALRDAVRTIIGFAVAFILVKFVGPETADQLAGPVESGIVVLVSMIFAFAGKKFRNGDGPEMIQPVGKLV